MFSAYLKIFQRKTFPHERVESGMRITQPRGKGYGTISFLLGSSVSHTFSFDKPISNQLTLVQNNNNHTDFST